MNKNSIFDNKKSLILSKFENTGFDSTHLQKAQAFFSSLESRALYHFNPRFFAECIGSCLRESLKLLVYCLTEGLVVLHWNILCKACGAINQQPGSLQSLSHQVSCSMCHSQFFPHLDDEIQISFSRHPSLGVLEGDFDQPQYRHEIDRKYGVVSAHDLLLVPEFRQFCPDQRLHADESLEVTRVALLFTDLAGSTALYAARGDPRAYQLVRKHFEVLFSAADKAGGAVIKTIGDAVLAAFHTPQDALTAALLMHKNLRALNQNENLIGNEQLILKVGLHCGPCLSVNLNQQQDYFGSTVNIAARIQQVSRGEDIVLSSPMADDPACSKILSPFVLEPLKVNLKGIEGEQELYRISSVIL